MPLPRPNALSLALIIGLGITTAALAQDASTTDQNERKGRRHERELGTVVVTASPLGQQSDQLAQPVAVLAGAELEDNRSGTIGATVANVPGVQSSYFGPGVGRPIIRGLEGARVQVLSGGIGALDVSTVSSDHAVSIEPFLADQIEVLKGPSTLLYGSGAIGGVVNSVDGRMAESPVNGLSGRAQWHGDTAAQERGGMARIDAGNGRLALHADYVRRYSDDNELADDAELLNSAQDLRSVGAGVGYTGERGYAGMALSTYDNLYGIPLGSSAEEIDADEEVVRLDISQTRVDAKASLANPFGAAERITARVSQNDYEHVELADGEIGTRFTNDAYEARVELVHTPWGVWHGAYGVQFGSRDFAAIGEEAFVPPAQTDDFGVFWVEQAEFEPVTLELGARYDKQEIDLDQIDGGADHRALSVSFGGIWTFNEHWHASLNLDRAQRAPSAEELFSDGPHEATASYEIGDAALDEETANQIELSLHAHGERVEAKVSAFYNRYDDFIFLVDTGEIEPEEGLPVLQWTQDDARFHGFEAEARYTLADNAWGRWTARAFGDVVRARLADGGDLPRIAPARLGLSLNWQYDAWRASLGAVRHAEQDHVAVNETPTDGYTFVNAHVSYAFAVGDSEWEAFLDGRNLTDQDARVHTSLLKDRAPLPGRNIAFGLRTYF
jgi:iron complex outermembrane receptor protein